MRAMRLHRPAPIGEAPLRLETTPVPTVGPGQLGLRVRACAICRTDLHVVEGDLPWLGRPVVPGHQIVATIETLGQGVTGFSVGDRVGVAWLRQTCQSCNHCHQGAENLCESSRFTGYHEDGGYSEYAVVPADFAYPIPEIFSDVEATPLLCAGIIGYRALKRSNVPKDGRVLLYGFGSSAHVTLQIALHWGCEVFVATRGERRRQLARAMGAAWVGGINEQPPATPQSAIVFAPAGELVPLAMAAIDKGGTVATAGIVMSDIPTLRYEPELFYEKTLQSVTANTRADAHELMQIAAAIPIRARVTKFALEDANQALLRLKQGDIAGSGVLVA